MAMITHLCNFRRIVFVLGFIIAQLTVMSTSLLNPHSLLSLKKALSSPPLSSTTITNESVEGQPSRRAVFSSIATKAAVASAFMATSCQYPQPAEAKWFWEEEKKTQGVSYETFKSLLLSDQVKQVEFGYQGTSLSFVDEEDCLQIINEIPDDKGLIRALYQRNVVVKLEKTKIQRQMNSYDWFRDLSGAGDELTDEERYTYKGYKTYRKNIPDRPYVRSDLISG
mmetsp:Transcript_36687/g.85732  ORF Transcript_36687/g.85732 Transcript_36687/m.85732 type:complete len:225 (-) Transcript_36687:445-1119(-)